MAGRRIVNQGTFRRTGKRRATEWSICSAPTGFSTIGIGLKVILVSIPAATLADVGPATIVRTRGQFSIAPSNAAADTDINGAFGIGFVNEVGGLLGVTGTPGPWTDCDWGGWFVHQFFNMAWEAPTDVGQDYITREFDIDSRAMRKFESGLRLMWVVENGGGSSFKAAVSARMLVKAG